MRRRLWPAAVFLVMGTASVLSAKAATGADDAVVAANAGNYAAFRLQPSAESPMPPAVGLIMRQLLGADFGDPRALANLTVDHDRSIVLSACIVDPARLQALLASPEVPPLEAPLGIRNLLV